MEKYTVEIQDGFEDPSQSAYYDALGSVNLYDLSFLANLDDNAIKNTFVTVPVGVMEVNSSGDSVRYVRSNQAFREFMNHAFGFNLSDPETEYTVPKKGPGSSFMKAVEQCRNNGNRAFVDEEMDDGSTVHSFVRRVSVNPVTGTESVAIAVLSITPPDENTTYADIARALAADYYNLFVIDLDTNDYTEYASQVGGEEMSVVRHGKEFFESARRDTLTRIYEEDREPFLALFTKENVLRDLDAQGVFTTTYRLIDTGNPMYVNMKITRMRGGNRIILGISIIDSQMQQREQYEELRRERESMVRVKALSDGYLTLFTIDPKTGKYIEYSSSDDFDSLGAKKDGNDFFGQAYVDAFTYCYEEDRQRFQEQVTQGTRLINICSPDDPDPIYHATAPNIQIIIQATGDGWDWSDKRWEDTEELTINGMIAFRDRLDTVVDGEVLPWGRIVFGDKNISIQLIYLGGDDDEVLKVAESIR